MVFGVGVANDKFPIQRKVRDCLSTKNRDFPTTYLVNLTAPSYPSLSHITFLGDLLLVWSITMASNTGSENTSAVCTVCQKDASSLSHPMKHCAKCKATPYCSKDCQKADWKAHKKICARQASATAERAPSPPRSRLCNGGYVAKACSALSMLSEDPKKWFKDTEIDERDLSLVFADKVKWMKYDQSSFVRKIVSSILIRAMSSSNTLTVSFQG